MKLEGRLMYMGWTKLPWTLETNDGEIDLWPVIEEFFVSINGKKAEHKRTKDSYVLFADENSEMEFTYISGQYVLLKSVDGIGMSNVNAHLNESLIWLSGRLIKVEFELGKRIKISADESEEVHGVYRIEGSNACEVCKGDERIVCKIGQPDCCIFLTMGVEGFYYCEKFSGMLARELLYRLVHGDIRATRIGNCKLLIRDKE